MNYLIDTDIIIYSIKGFERVNQNFHEYRSSPKSISVISYGEVIYGARKSRFVDKNLAKVYRISELFPVISLTASVMDTFGGLKASLDKSGMGIDDMDLLIASTALVHNLVLVTNNEKHFGRIPGLEIENWTS